MTIMQDGVMLGKPDPMTDTIKPKGQNEGAIFKTGTEKTPIKKK